MKTYEVGIKNRKPRFIIADKMEVDYRGALVFKDEVNSSERSKRYEITLIVNAQKWDYVQLQEGIKFDVGNKEE